MSPVKQEHAANESILLREDRDGVVTLYPEGVLESADRDASGWRATIYYTLLAWDDAQVRTEQPGMIWPR